ncbi:hypothetical protein BC835DRAFT_255473 [Cytidiella melzeri]|nr:hypothetical protein BC835DRAFT_255473 [Cytidiella melzeri]
MSFFVLLVIYHLSISIRTTDRSSKGNRERYKYKCRHKRLTTTTVVSSASLLCSSHHLFTTNRVDHSSSPPQNSCNAPSSVDVDSFILIGRLHLSIISNYG